MRLQHLFIVRLLTRTCRQQVREVEGLPAERERSVQLGQEAGIGRVHKTWLIRVGWYNENAYSEFTQHVAQPIPL
jgi:hypothetical protein